MCYLVLCEIPEGIESTAKYDTLAEARKNAEICALDGRYSKVTVWLHTHTVEVRPQAFWQEHAKGLSGNGN